jgi:hypothetical protein
MAMADDRLDPMIDDAARQMTVGEPPADLRARVLARIGSGPHRSWHWRPAWALSSLAVSVILAVLMLRGPWRSQAGPDPGATDTKDTADVRLTAPAEATAVRRSLGPGGMFKQPRKPDTTDGEGNGAIARFAGAATSGLALNPLDIEPLGVDAMEPTALAPLGVDALESIDVPRLAVAPLEVAALETQ